jgi:hypothetical protein
MRIFYIGICAAVLLACAIPALASGSPFSLSGQVIDRHGNPVQGANVTLIDFNYKIIGIRQTAENGIYVFPGVSPTTDDGKPIQAKKDVKAMVEYASADGVKRAAWSEPGPLYYPDVLMGNGMESRARDVTLPILLSSGDGIPPQPTVSVSEVPPAVPASNVVTVPLLAALAIGLLCLAGMYLVLNRKG